MTQWVLVCHCQWIGTKDPKDYERTVATLMSGGSDPVITKKPIGAWTHAVYDAMK
jgi:NitT/TauT family transport system substrate-binding protein